MDRLKQAKQLASSFKSGGGKKDGSEDVIKQALSSSQQQLKQLDAEQNDKQIRKAMVQSFLQVQSKMEKQTGFDCSLSGSTVVGIYKERKTIYFANAGDSRGIIIGQTTGY